MSDSHKVVVIGGVACGCNASGFTDVSFMEGGITTWPYGLKKTAQ